MKIDFNQINEELKQYLREDQSAVDYLIEVGANHKDDISAEICNADFDGELYLTAEEFTRDERENLGSFCLAMADPNATVNVNKFVSDLENILERIMYQENVINKTMSDDGFAYAINSLDMGTRLFEFEQNLKSKKGEDLCVAIQNSDICRKASELSEELARYYDSLGE